MASETIQISPDLKQELNKMKSSSRETYEETIWRIIEDKKELSEQTKRDVLKARKEIARGDFVELQDLKKKYSIL